MTKRQEKPTLYDKEGNDYGIAFSRREIMLYNSREKRFYVGGVVPSWKDEKKKDGEKNIYDAAKLPFGADISSMSLRIRGFVKEAITESREVDQMHKLKEDKLACETLAILFNEKYKKTYDDAYAASIAKEWGPPLPSATRNRTITL